MPACGTSLGGRGYRLGTLLEGGRGGASVTGLKAFPFSVTSHFPCVLHPASYTFKKTNCMYNLIGFFFLFFKVFFFNFVLGYILLTYQVQKNTRPGKQGRKLLYCV